MEVFYIDDDIDDIELFEQALLSVDPGIDFTYALGCEEAIDKLSRAQNKPDAIFLDLRLPKIEGLECIQMIKKDVELSHIPIVAISTSITSRQVDEFNKMGVYYFLSKSALLSDIAPALKVIIDSLCKDTSPRQTGNR
jgi:CheY-like chemotaxis protein